jgi:uncharacterized RDD family membrane protein YckC
MVRSTHQVLEFWFFAVSAEAWAMLATELFPAGRTRPERSLGALGTGLRVLQVFGEELSHHHP